MGYLAVAGGTVGIALLAHALLTRSSTSPLVPNNVDQIKLEENDSSADSQVEKDRTTPDPRISIVTEDDAQSLPLPSLTVEPPAAPVKPAATPPPKSLAVQLMPPPPRPFSAPDLNALNVARAMPPPSSLPPSRAHSPPRLKPATSSRPPTLNPTPGGSSLRPPPSAASSLRVPPQKVLQNTHMQPSTSTLPPNSSLKPSKKVTLQPGHSPLDWAALQRTASLDPSSPAGIQLRGKDAPEQSLSRIKKSQLKAQNGRKGKDAWSTFRGRVYNISAYADFHPGGRAELMRGAGKSSDELFAEVHPWVNWEGMMSECCLGILVQDEEAGDETGKRVEVKIAGGNSLDEMD